MWGMMMVLQGLGCSTKNCALIVSSVLSGVGQSIKAAHNFQLFGTVTQSGRGGGGGGRESLALVQGVVKGMGFVRRRVSGRQNSGWEVGWCLGKVK